MIFSIVHICHLSDCDGEFQTAESLYHHLRADHHMDIKKARSHYTVAQAIERMGGIRAKNQSDAEI